MNKTDKAESVNDEIELLLPWYITGKLTRADIVRVETYLDQYPDARKRMKLLHAERDETIMLNRSGNTKPATSPNQLLNQIVGAKQRGKSQLLQWIDGRLRTPFGGWRHWAGAAAMLLIMIQAGAIYMLARNPSDGQYREATESSGPVSQGTFLLVQFAENASLTDITALLQDLNMTIVDGPKAGGLFKLRIGLNNLTPEERNKRMNSLSARKDLVLFVSPTH